ncbi:MAG TPA: SGNH/GDSL hydrolase family protein [Spirochaetota bacterium]|nr:SGNH/GDSL hydrolase family protein [Spirochaetota bacterium]HPC42699.1 SGNH/GDSL hydrolase family protein [Spirochaetota bacterium]HPL15774.1 SGNH/GDSL hydrolase family protein [Spirochaetota bacterium]HQF07832.1 SGNH/GDSL hydrolase family protein [Spirochaetota bacterium]HQH96885.1 SGNH/GDSL hydrolase family protein [Spirochaetota bacterium]
MKQKKIIIIADSVSMPRHGVAYEETWIHMLKREFPAYDIMDRTARGSTSTRLVTEGGGGADLLESYMPDIVILQIGMAEAAPRLFDKRGLEYALVSRYMPPRLRQRYIEYIKKRRVRSPEITDVAPEQFRKNITAFFERAKMISARIILIPILPTTDEYARKSPHAPKNVERYNAIYRETAALFENVTIVDPFRPGIDINAISIDELHINPEGSKLVFNALKPLL